MWWARIHWQRTRSIAAMLVGAQLVFGLLSCARWRDEPMGVAPERVDVQIFTPAGQPAAGAQIIVYAAGDEVMIPARPKWWRKQGPPSGLTTPDASVIPAAADGRARVSLPDTAWLIAVEHDSGYVMMTAEQIRAGGRVDLQEWGTILGTVEPRKLQLIRVSGFLTAGEHRIPYQRFVLGDEARFGFENLPPGEWEVAIIKTIQARHSELADGRHALVMITAPSHGRLVHLGAGETTFVELESGEHPVRGHFLVDEDTEADQRPIVFARLVREGAAAPLMTSSSDHSGQMIYWLDVSNDLSFRVDGVPLGDYRLEIACQRRSGAPSLMHYHVSLLQPRWGEVIHMGEYRVSVRQEETTRAHD